MERRVVITGMGLICPVGNNKEQAWEGLVNGLSGIGAITAFDPGQLKVAIAGEVKGFDFDAVLSPKDQKKTDRFVHLGLAAARQAYEDAGITLDEAQKERFGVFAASGTGGLITFESSARTVFEKGAARLSPLFTPKVLANMLPGNISIALGAKGPSMAALSACATGAHNIGQAAWLIKYGQADYMLAGGAEAAVCELGIAGFASMRALSTRNAEPERASRPWDRDRDGFVVGEGAGMVFMESHESAKKRGARIHAEVVGFGMSSDAWHITQPSPDGEGAARCMRATLASAGLNPEDIDYINAHGTSTPAGDLAEALAIKSIFGPRPAGLNITSTKSMTGHLLGGAGGVEAVFTALSLARGVVTPTINLEKPDEECQGLNLTPGQAQERPMTYGLSNSFGFGGTNAALILKKPD